MARVQKHEQSRAALIRQFVECEIQARKEEGEDPISLSKLVRILQKDVDAAFGKKGFCVASHFVLGSLFGGHYGFSIDVDGLIDHHPGAVIKDVKRKTA